MDFSEAVRAGCFHDKSESWCGYMPLFLSGGLKSAIMICEKFSLRG